MDVGHIECRISDVAGQTHHEIIIHNLLVDIDNIDIGLGHGHGNACNDADLVLAGHGQNANLLCFFLFGLSHTGSPDTDA